VSSDVRTRVHRLPPRFARTGPLVLTVDDSGSTQVLRIAGDLDLATAGQVTAALDRLELNRTSLLVIDLQRLNFLDLAGLRTILRADERCRNDQIRLTVIKPRGFAGRVFTLTSAHRELELVAPPATG
jgi:anti-sigma B factor antagonist